MGDWEPPFCATRVPGLSCSKCGEKDVHAREQESYLDGVILEAFCGECHAMLEVLVTVEIEFSDVGLAYGEDDDTTSTAGKEEDLFHPDCERVRKERR